MQRTIQRNVETKKQENEEIELNDIRVVERMAKSIISIGQLLKEGGRMSGDDDKLIIIMKSAKIIFVKNKVDGLYYTKLQRDNLHDDYCNNVNENEWEIINRTKQRWPKISRVEAHMKWGHPHYEQLNKMAKYYRYNVYGKLLKCGGCCLVKSRAMKTTRTTNKAATKKGERLFIDTTGPYPKSRGGMKYWMCAVDDFTDKTWTHFATSKNQMMTFVRDLITMMKGLDLKVKYIRCDNAGEHQSKLQNFCKEQGIVLEYTAPNSPKQNGRVEKKIHILWQRAMVQMVNARLSVESQNNFWAESVSCANFVEDLIIKGGRDQPALASWTNDSVNKWIKRMIQFGRLGVVNKRSKLKGKMNEKGFSTMMVGYAPNHGPGTYKLYNPKTNRIIYSRDIEWIDYEGKRIEDDFDIFEPGIESDESSEIEKVVSGENLTMESNSSMSSSNDENETIVSYNTTSDESYHENDKSSNKKHKTKIRKTKKKSKRRRSKVTFDDESSSTYSDSSDERLKNENDSDDSSEEEDSEVEISRGTTISKPRTRSRTKQTLRRSPRTQNKTKPPTTTISVQKKLNMVIGSEGSDSGKTTKVQMERKKIVTGDTEVKPITIETEDEEEKEDTIIDANNCIEETGEADIFCLYTLSDFTENKLYESLKTDEIQYMKIYTLELMSDAKTPSTITQALNCQDKELWRKSAIAEVNNFLKRKSWKFIPKTVALSQGRKLIGVKWVFKIKDEADFSKRYKTRAVTKGYMQIPGVDYTEIFSPVAQASTIRVVLGMALYYY